MTLHNQTVVVTGGTRGLGRGVVEALTDRGASVTVVARNRGDLEDVGPKVGAETIIADITDKEAARNILRDIKPSILVLNAGAPPEMAPLDEHTWESFSNTWETDVKGGLYWVQSALRTPLDPGSRVLVTSSGAAIGGSPLSGGYAGAKRMLWIMANYAQKISDDKELGILFQTIVPRQMVGGTGTGDGASMAYARKLGITPEEHLKRFGAAMPPRHFGDLVAEILSDERYEQHRAFGLKGDSGITVLEEPEF